MEIAADKLLWLSAFSEASQHCDGKQKTDATVDLRPPDTPTGVDLLFLSQDFDVLAHVLSSGTHCIATPVSCCCYM